MPARCRPQPTEGISRLPGAVVAAADEADSGTTARDDGCCVMSYVGLALMMMAPSVPRAIRVTQSSRRGADGVGLPGRTSRPGASESRDEIPVGVCLKAFKRPRTPSESATLTGVCNAILYRYLSGLGDVCAVAGGSVCLGPEARWVPPSPASPPGLGLA
jgi:hypothetical protein